MIFKDRSDAGRRLAELLESYARRDDLLVLGLPRGGVPVAYEVARRLQAPLDVFLVRKLGVPGEEELAMGAIASGGVLVLNDAVVRALHIPPRMIEEVAAAERKELSRRERAYRDHRPAPDPRGRCAILVDDGLATGASMHSAVEGLRKQEPGQIVVAVPVAARATLDALEPLVDRLVCLATPEPFHGVGQWYEDFRQTSDEEVRRLLQEPNSWRPS
jgi:predicted phosphoribosyltransferase